MMKKTLLLLLMAVAITASAQNFPGVPEWTHNTPKAGNDTYIYVVERGGGNTVNAAINNALLKVLRTTIMRLGTNIDWNEVNRALQEGRQWGTIAHEFNIPINKVCEFVEDNSNGYRVAILCQVAKRGGKSYYPNFDEFSDCYKGVNKPIAKNTLEANGFGIYRNGRLLRDYEVLQLFGNSKAYSYYKKGNRIWHSGFWNSDDFPISCKYNGITAISIGGCMALLGYGFAALEEDGKIEEGRKDQKTINDLRTMGVWGVRAAAVGCGMLLLRCGVLAYGKAQIRKAVKLYNSGELYSRNAYEFEYGFMGSGAYLSFRF